MLESISIDPGEIGVAKDSIKATIGFPPHPRTVYWKSTESVEWFPLQKGLSTRAPYPRNGPLEEAEIIVKAVYYFPPPWSGKVVEEAIDNVKADIHLPPRCPRKHNKQEVESR
jgi:hypothetical protein